MIFVVTGGSGLLGQALIKKLLSENHKVYNISRKSKTPITGYKEFVWSEDAKNFPLTALPEKESYGFINLAGEPVSNWPWTKKQKEKIYSSRVYRTQQLISALEKRPPQFFISASAIGIYGEQGGQVITEENSPAFQDFFLQKVCLDWEKSALMASSLCRTVIFRLGVVLSYEKGFLYEQSKWIKKGILPSIFSLKEHWFSWISIEDLTELILWFVKNKHAKGVYNAVSPKPVSLNRFYFVLKQENKSIPFPLILLPCPLFVLKTIGGEMFKNLLMSSRVVPKKALSEGFTFKQTELEKALKRKLESSNKLSR